MNAISLRDALIQAILTWDAQAVIYSEQIPQGFSRPCFFINIIQQDKSLMDTRLQRSFAVCIHFYPPKNNHARETALETAQQLSSVLEWVDVDGLPRRFLEPHFKLLDDHTAKFECRYTCHVIRKEDIQKMGAFSHSIYSNTQQTIERN